MTTPNVKAPVGLVETHVAQSETISSSAPVPEPAPAVKEIPAFASPPVSPESASSLPSIQELINMIQEFFCGAYSRTHKVVEEELPALIQILLSESTLAAGATVRSVVDTVLAASNVIRQHPVVIQLLQYLDHPRVNEVAQQLLQKLQTIVKSGHLVIFRDRVVNFVSQIPSLVSILHDLFISS